jgi:hypothetical protein
LARACVHGLDHGTRRPESAELERRASFRNGCCGQAPELVPSDSGARYCVSPPKISCRLFVWHHIGVVTCNTSLIVMRPLSLFKQVSAGSTALPGSDVTTEMYESIIEVKRSYLGRLESN